ncbi:MAG: GNAT family N-acetyltransferase [Eubacteriales bacterium]|nr:GNAT family N-acetyltransferase [Eubacteriales bacterium]
MAIEMGAACMEMQMLSKSHKVTRLGEQDIPAVFEFCRKNPRYYQYCPPEVSPEGIKADMRALPEGKSIEDKFYLGFWAEDKLAAVLDLILNYPDDKTAFIGFFMMNADMQGKGTGSKIIEEICDCLGEPFSFVRLGYVKGNEQSERFWMKNGFRPIGEISQTEHCEIVVMQRKLRHEETERWRRRKR